MALKCDGCKENINRDKVSCYGLCNRVFHSRCVGVNTNAVKSLLEFNNIKYVCNDCENNTYKSIMKKVDGLLESLLTEKNLMSEINENVNIVKEAIRNNDDKLKKMESNIMNKERLTYADKVKELNEPVVLVIPKDKQTSITTCTEVKSKIDPMKVPIHSLSKSTKGTVILKGKPKADIEEIKKYAEVQMGNKYSVKITELKKPRIKVVGMSEKLEVEDIVKKIKVQNTTLNDADITVLQIYGNRCYNAILEIDSVHFNKIMSSKRINIGWDRCIVYEHFLIRKCFKCNGYNHKYADCTNKVSCKKCSGEHDIKDCDSEIVKCINCSSVNKKLNLNFDTNHKAHSVECKVMERHIENERKRVCYNVDE